MTIDAFEEHRSLLTGVAYRILGTMADAEDVVQETWLRWSSADRTDVDDPRAYLVTIASRLAVDRLRSARSRRESYVGEWLPEPVSDLPDGADSAELADSVEFALLVVLETLSPLERAVFVLREAFQMPYAEIARVIGRGEAATRQLSRRAREHVHERRPRFEADRAVRRRITERFLKACLEGDLEGLTGMLAADATLVGDGGGRVRAPLRVLSGAAKVVRFLIALPANAARYLEQFGLPGDTPLRVEVTEVNGSPAGTVSAGGRVVSTVVLDVADDRVRHVYVVSNPDKTTRIQVPGPS
ncbi:RNA polymerase sigma factor SigJ [Nocardiopsis algeriensis]|uniref:RNA polymerase sigma-70 factor (ECF subfamily) n=1 Tax=Nocardiopsis algeriensis TaxID=1478215 RepID=A0A841IWU6_9ACTN|nr:RNA polymerase sigma factor SigJ [Nocardiopsis algeriensis]MBB6120965.1 RNA polymerase sigma-70 factor (ECF subfamily) [Nocardiopsis algeriensis]